MDESEANISWDGKEMSLSSDKPKPKKRSLVERELETSLTARVTSPATGVDSTSTSRYGRARRAKTDNDFCNTEKAVTMVLKSPNFDKTPIKSPAAYKMHASNSPVRVESALQNQIENIYSANISLSRFASDEKPGKTPSPAVKKFPKTYVKTDLIQTKEKEETITLIKNMFSPNKSAQKSNNHLNNILERSSEKYALNRNMSKQQNGYVDKASIVKTLDFDSKQSSKSKEVSMIKKIDFDCKNKRKERETPKVLSKSELFDLEAKCEYQVGDLAWARMGTFPFWPCIVTREPDTNMFVRIKLFGRIERNLIHVTFFGDNGRRSWILDTMMRKFQGLKEFETTRDQFKPEDKKKDPRLYAAFFISDKKQALWLKSVEEAETFMKEPKRLRIELLYDLLGKSKIKQNQKSQKKVTRADSDVSLSESLLDTLFSEDDAKSDDPDRAKKRKSLDVSEVVTACLDSMAARTGLTQIQKQSHMDRWLQKAKSKTPEKSQLEITVTVEEVDEAIEQPKVTTQIQKKISEEDNSKKKYVPLPFQKPYSLRNSTGESRNLLPIHNEHDYSAKFSVDNCYVKLENLPLNDQVIRTCISVNDVKDINNKINKENNDQNSFTNEAVDDQIQPKILNEIVTEGVLESNKYITLENISSSEMDVDSSFNDIKIPREAVDETCNEIENKNERNAFTNTVVSKQIESEISNKIVTEEIIETENYVVTEILSASETDVDKNDRKIDQGAVVDNYDKINTSRDLVTNTFSNKNRIEMVESIQEYNEYSKDIAQIPSKTEQENILGDPPPKNSGDYLTDNKDYDDMSCDNDTSDWNIETPLVKDEPMGITSKLEANMEQEKEETKIYEDKVNIESVTESVPVDTIKADKNMTEIHSVKKITLNIEEQLSNEIECSVGEPNDKIKDVKETNLLSDADMSMLSDNGIAEKHLIESNVGAKVTLQKNMSDMVLESLTDNNDKETREKKNNLEFDVKNDFDSEIKKNESKINNGLKSEKYNDEVLSDADINMLSDNGIAEKHLIESNVGAKVTLQKNMSDMVLESLTDNNDKETLEKKNNLKFHEKNDLDIETNKNETKINNGLKCEKHNDLGSEINNDLTSKINNYSESEINNDLGSAIKNVPESEMKKNDSESKINNDLASEIKKNVSESKIIKNDITPQINRNDLESETKNNNLEPEKKNTKLVKRGECSVVVVPLNGPILNGYHKNKLRNTKEDDYTDSDTASTNSEFDDLSLNDLKKITRARRNLTLNKQNSNENLVAIRETNSQSPLLKVVNVFSGEINIYGKASASIENDDSIVTKRVLRPRIDTPVESLNLNKESSPEIRIKEEIDSESASITSEGSNVSTKRRGRAKDKLTGESLNLSKESSPEIRIKEEIDSETASITSEGSNVSAKRRGRAKDKVNEEDTMKDPEFVRYLELRQDTLIDEHPELSFDEIVAYLYKTWLYEQSCKSEFVKNHDKEQSHLVKGLKPDAPQANKKKQAKQDKNKLININKVFKKELIEEFACVPFKDKPKRKTSQPCYVEDYSDIEDEIKMFEIFKNQKDKSKTAESQQKVVASTSYIKEETVKTSEIKEEITEELSPEEYYDEVEAYFEELTKPKPNIFKGLVREKVCEICEKTSNLVKCKGCNCMFHIECIRKETDIIDVPVSIRGRKKKKKPRGRRPKSSTDSNGLDESYSDEKSQDVSMSEENKSFEEILDESHIVVANVEDFEAQLAAKMTEMIEIEDKINYDSYSSDDCLDWRDTIAGKCEIVDVKLKPKRPEIDGSNFKCNNCQKEDVPLCFVCKSPVSPKSQINHRQKCQVAHCHKFYHLECLEYWPQTQFNTVDPYKKKGNINEPSETLSCPRHVCHTCVCDDPRGCKTRFSGDKLARCVRCPATYHSFTKCLPAGTQILTASHIICPRHYEHRPGKVPCHVNTGWCFICAQGGTLICCEYCPTSFHAECLQIDPPDGGYMCEDCETGRLPLYGEMVWVKLGHYRWWPGLILHPYQIPPNIMAVRHSPGEFVVRFFGQYDHYWVNRGRVFPYQEGDSGRISSQKSKIDEAFSKAMEHAQRAYEILKTFEENEEESPDLASSLLPPHYVKLRTNKPYGSVTVKREVEESSLTQCECDPSDEQPCGPMSHCLNRMLLTECGPSCRAGDYCNNRAFERREYPRLTAYRTKHRGWGLKALEDIKAGQFVIEYVGELIDEEEFRRRMRRKHEVRDENFYFLTLDKERMIDAGPKGNLARFMNHCCEPNCETQKWTVLGDIRVGLFALRDIPANSELTFNYNLECAGIEKKRCMCGAKRCSGYIGAKPKQEEKETQKKPKMAIKRPYKKRKPEDAANDKNKPKRPVGRPPKPRELTEIEKDLLIIKNATNGISSDSECSGRLSSVDVEGERKDIKALKRKRVSFSSEDTSDSKRLKYDDDKTSSEID